MILSSDITRTRLIFRNVPKNAVCGDDAALSNHWYNCILAHEGNKLVFLAHYMSHTDGLNTHHSLDLTGTHVISKNVRNSRKWTNWFFAHI
jgi:hypothetical protein